MRTGAIGTAFLVAVATAGCTAHHNSPPPNHPATSTSPAVTAQAAPPLHPQRGGTLRLVGLYGATSLDPNATAWWVDYALLRLVSRQLYTWPADPAAAASVVPDLATAAPIVDDTGTVYRITIRRGARWNTSRPRPVTAADVVRGVKVMCTPNSPALGVLFDVKDVIVGMRQFCQGFGRLDNKGEATRGRIRRYVERTPLPGVRVGDNSREVVFQLTRPVNYFPDLLALPAFSPRPREMFAWRLGSVGASQNLVSDGPYRVNSYVPGTPGTVEPADDFGSASMIVLGRNRVWNADTDPIRGAYVNKVEARFPPQPVPHARLAFRALRSGHADSCLCTFEQSRVRRLIRRDDHAVVHPSLTAYPLLVFNTASPNNAGALGDVDVRRALSYAIDRTALVRLLGGAELAPPLTHVLPEGITGAASFDPYPRDVERARQLLRDAGVRHLHLRYYTRLQFGLSLRIFHTLRAQLREAGVDLERFYEDERWPGELYRPASAQRGEWDLALAGWSPDWPGRSEAAFFRALFGGRGAGHAEHLPDGSSNFGLYDNPEVDRLIDEATAADADAATELWHRADELVMEDAPVIPIAQPRVLTYRGDRLRHDIFLPALHGPDLANVWLARRG